MPSPSKQSKLKIMVDYPCDIWIDSSFITKLTSGKISVLPIGMGTHYIELYDGDILIDEFDFIAEIEDYEYLLKRAIVKAPLFSIVENCNGIDYAFKFNNKFGLWNGKRALCRAIYDEIQYERCFADEPYLIKSNCKYGLLSPQGYELVTCSYDNLSSYTLEPGNLQIFGYLLEWLSTGRKSLELQDWVSKRTLKLDDYTTPAELTKFLPVFFVQKVQIGLFFGFIDLVNEILVPIEFEDCILLNSSDVSGNWMSQYDSQEEYTFDKTNTPALYFGVKKNGKWGVMTNGQLKTNIEFDECDYYNYGIFSLRKGCKSCAWDINKGMLIDWMPNEQFKKEFFYRIVY